MVRIAICDDLAADRQALRQALSKEFQLRGITAEFVEYESGTQLVSEWKKDKPLFKWLFLDIYMEGLNGVETAQRLRGLGCQTEIVFLTTTPDYALDGYEVYAAGYLLKPLLQEKLGQLLDRLLSQAAQPPVLTLRSGASVVSVDTSDILYIESLRNRLSIYTINGTIPHYGRLDDLARQRQT